MEIGDTKKPLFKKKQIKGKSKKVRRESNDLDEGEGPLTFKTKKPLFVKNTAKSSNILKWTKPQVRNEDETSNKVDDFMDGRDIKDFNEGDIIVPESEESYFAPKKYVPLMDLGADLSRKTFLNQVTNEYSDDEEDEKHDNIIADDLEMNIDDVIVEDNDIDDEKYDLQLSSDDEDVIRVIEPLTIPQELERLEKLITNLKISKQSKMVEYDVQKQQLISLSDRKSRLVDEILKV